MSAPVISGSRLTGSGAKTNRNEALRDSTLGLISFLADACVKASGGLRPRVDTGQPGQGDDVEQGHVEQGGPDVAVPVIG